VEGAGARCGAWCRGRGTVEVTGAVAGTGRGGKVAGRGSRAGGGGGGEAARQWGGGAPPKLHGRAVEGPGHAAAGGRAGALGGPLGRRWRGRGVRRPEEERAWWPEERACGGRWASARGGWRRLPRWRTWLRAGGDESRRIGERTTREFYSGARRQDLWRRAPVHVGAASAGGRQRGR
jgi:hypothetical protein